MGRPPSEAGVMGVAIPGVTLSTGKETSEEGTHVKRSRPYNLVACTRKSSRSGKGDGTGMYTAVIDRICG